MKRDYYEILGVPGARTRRRSRRPSGEGPRAASGRQPGPRGRGAVQGGGRGLRDALEPRDARLYDRYGHDGPARAAPARRDFADFGSFQDLFDAFFGGDVFGRRGAASRGRGRGRGRSGSRSSSRRSARPARSSTRSSAACETCDGAGAAPGQRDRPLRDLRRPGPGAPGVARTVRPVRARRRSARHCHGAGETPRRALRRLPGRRPPADRASRSTVDIPAGIANGQRIRIDRAGRGRRARAPRPATSTCTCRWPRTSASGARASTW